MQPRTAIKRISLHREDLNPLDKAEAIVLEIANTTQLKSEEIVPIVSAVSSANLHPSRNQSCGRVKGEHC